MQGPHRTILTYLLPASLYPDADGDGRQIEVGETTAVPRQGETVWCYPVEDRPSQQFAVEYVTWSIGQSPCITWVLVVLTTARL